MPKARLSEIATSWVDEDIGLKKKVPKPAKSITREEEEAKKKQTFSLRIGTIKRLWSHRVNTNTTISQTIDELVAKHIPE